MVPEDIDNYLNKKLNEDKDEIICTYYDLRVNNNWSKEYINELFLPLAKNRLENAGYRVYFEGEKFVYKDANRVVHDNEYLIAVKIVQF